MTTLPDIGLALLASSQAQPEVTHNEALARLLPLFRGVVTQQNAPPGGPTEGDCYIVGIAGSGAWAGKDNKLAIYYGGSWRFVPDVDSAGDDIPMGTRHEGMKVYNQAANAVWVWSGAAWAALTAGNAVASVAEYRANTADRVLETDIVWAAADYVALTEGANIAVDMAAGINFSVTLAGNRTLSNPTNTKNGQSGLIVISQDGTGSRTLAYGSNWEFSGGTAPVLSTTASAKDLLFYQVISATAIYATLVKAVG